MLSSIFQKFLSSSILIDCVIRFLEFFLQKCEIFHDCRTIPNISLTHSFLLSWILFSLQILNDNTVTDVLAYLADNKVDLVPYADLGQVLAKLPNESAIAIDENALSY